MTQVKYLSVTTSSSSVSFSPSVLKVIIKNIGSNPCFINLNSSATTNHFSLDPEEIIEIGLNSISSVHAICSSGTTNLSIIGIEEW